MLRKFRSATKQTSLLLPLIFIGFITCSQEDPKEPEPEPVVVIVEEPTNIPEIAATVCDYNVDDDDLTSIGWEKAFEDHFDNDLSKWNIWTGGAFNNELQHYQAANVAVNNGMLVIKAKKETVTGATNPFDATQKTFDFTSGRIECKSIVSSNSVTPKVRMMARIKLPAGYGLWPAFWSYGDPWPTHGEIDIVEARGTQPTKYQTNYFYGTTAGSNLVQGGEGYIEADSDLTSCFHVYELVWEESKLTSFLDGEVVEVKKSGGYIPEMFGKNQRITLNLAVGGLFMGNINPDLIEGGEMQVDWVKVFTAR